MSKVRARSFGRRANNPFSQSTFMIDGLSQFDWSHTNSWSQDFGDLRPIECYDLIMGTRMRCNLSYVLNMDPLRKPLYAGITTTYDAIYISDMLLGYDSESFFNPSEQLGVASDDTTSSIQPCVNAGLLLYSYYVARYHNKDDRSFVQHSGTYVPRPIYNTLYDAFGYPFNSRYFDTIGDIKITTIDPVVSSYHLSDFIDPTFIPDESFSMSGPWIPEDTSTFVDDDIVPGFTTIYPDGLDRNLSASLLLSSSVLNSNYLAEGALDNAYWLYIPSTTTTAANLVSFMSCLRYLLRFLITLKDHYINQSEFVSESSFLSWCTSNGFVLRHDNEVLSLSDVDWDGVCRFAGFGSYGEYLDVYKSYLYSKFYAGVALDQLYDMRPIFAYRRAYNDLYVNTNLWDCDEFSLCSIDSYYSGNIYKSINGFSPSLSTLATKIGNVSNKNIFVTDDIESDLFSSLELLNLGFLKRWFSNDMFTSAVPADMSAAANAVEIPSSGLTLIDLRNYNIDQMVNERISYAGERVTDSTFAFFGFKSPELRYRFARHISRMTDSPRIDNVLQNSQSSADSPLGTPAGYGYGAKTGRFFDFQMPWYGFIMILSSVMTEPVYRDAVDRLLMQKDYEDFLFPPYQEISDIAVTKMEIQPTGSDEDTDGFGYQRSYYYYMRQNNKLRGTMRLNEKIDWNLSRDMRDGFALNPDFAHPTASDRFNRIFADTSDGINHFNFFMGLDIQVTLPLKRDIHYHL